MTYEFTPGKCYVDISETNEGFVLNTWRCVKTFFRGLRLTPSNGTRILSMSCTSPKVQAGLWVECTEEVQRTAAFRGSWDCALVPIRMEHIGTIVAYPVTEGQMSAPCLLYGYKNGVAFLLSLDERGTTFPRRLSRIYPLQTKYKELIERARVDNPLASPAYDRFFDWLKRTSQYDTFVVNVAQQAVAETQTAMIQLFELLSYSGVTAEDFETVVDNLFNQLSEEERDAPSKYAAVLATYKTPARNYSKVDQEIMRITEFSYKTPKEAWDAVGGGRPYPKSTQDVYVFAPPNPYQYVADRLGYYDDAVYSHWYLDICPTVWPDEPSGRMIASNYQEGVAAYLELGRPFDMHQLDFITQPDKPAVFKYVLGVTELDSEDPYRAWTANPPPHFRKYRSLHPDLSYVSIFKKIYMETDFTDVCV